MGGGVGGEERERKKKGLLRFLHILTRITQKAFSECLHFQHTSRRVFVQLLHSHFQGFFGKRACILKRIRRHFKIKVEWSGLTWRRFSPGWYRKVGCDKKSTFDCACCDLVPIPLLSLCVCFEVLPESKSGFSSLA